MTDKKAIEWLKAMKRGVYPFPNDLKTRDEIFDTAISALTERSRNELSCTNCDHFGEGCEDCEVNDDD